MEPDKSKLRIRLPNGAELEAEGNPEFLQSERSTFLRCLGIPDFPLAPGLDPTEPPRLPRQSTAAPQAILYDNPALAPAIPWDRLVEIKGRAIQLRGKLGADKTEEDACLVLLAAAQKVLNQPKPTAAQLAQWLRTSGYPITRLDRVLAEAVHKGELLASGSRRARRYELTAPGRVRGFLLAQRLAALI